MDVRTTLEIPAPFDTERVVVRSEWVDYNGHMNVGFYPVAFDTAFDEVYNFLGVGGEDIRRTGISTFVAETHFTYQQELNAGDHLRITTQLLGFDAKRVHVFQCMYHAAQGYLAATGEWLILCVDLKLRRVIAMPPPLHDLVARVYAAHQHLPRPPEAGRAFSLTAGRPR
jgi:acyl-CoA thioester hydrolase